MTRSQLAHILRAAARIANDPNILVIGSQAILASHSENELPEVAWVSIEADIAFLDDDKSTKADEVDAAIGELSLFHKTNSYYAQGVDVTTAVLPNGWRERLVPFQPESSEPAHAVCLEKHDLIISKLVAMRQKDKEFATALLESGLVDIDVLLARASQLSGAPPAVANNVRQWLKAIRRRLLGLQRDH